METWKPIPSFPDYEASSEGRLRRAVAGHSLAPAGKLLGQRPKTKGYLYATLFRDGKRHTPRVHRLVAEAFVGPIPADMQVSHLNGVNTDNRAQNLAFETCTANNRRRIDHGTIPRGDAHHMRRAKLQREAAQCL